MSIWHIFVFAATTATFFTTAQDAPEVTTKSGKLIGRRDILEGVNVDAYLAVPYAQPPLGYLRFRKPVSVKPWEGIRIADELPLACPQYSPTPFPWNYNITENQNEDCLYLNIWTPSSAQQKHKAVMFYIHGGGFYLGASTDPVFDGKALAAIGDVVVVTINYRLGAPGFLYAEAEEISGNAGMYDMLLALGWVNDNIKAFGGNKNEITIFGQSAGSVSVAHLCLSDLTKGLFKRAILQSGSSFSLYDGKETNLQIGQEMAKYLNCADEETTLSNSPEKVVDCLHGVTAFDMANAIGTLQPYETAILLPVFGDPIVGMNPIESLKNGNFRDIEIMIGVVNDEGAYLVSTMNHEVFGYHGENNVRVNRTYSEYLIKSAMSPITVTDDIVDHYVGHLADDDYSRFEKQAYVANGDFILTCPTVYFADAYAKKENNVYFYSFEHRPSTSEWAPLMDVVHYDEVPFVFGKPIMYPELYLPSEVELSRRMIQLWTNFAKSGVPDDHWPIYSAEKQLVRTLVTTSNYVNKELPYKENCDFLRSYFEAADYRGLL